MVAPAIIGGGLSVLGGIFGSKGAKKAANVQVQSAEKGIGEIARQYDQTRADFAPWREAGGQAIGNLSAMLQPGYDHTTSPGYQFRFNEGQRAVEGSAASKGMLMSGGTLKDLTRFGQGVAADDFNQQFNRQASVAAGGQQVNTTLGQIGSNAANQTANLYGQQGAARASGYAGQNAAFQGTLGNLAYLFGGFGGGIGGGVGK
jgi:hypothetical protein